MKRVRWMGTGLVVGAAGSLWAEAAVRRRARQLRPDSVAKRAIEGARDLGDRVGEAVGEGRTAMREREAELRARESRPRQG